MSALQVLAQELSQRTLHTIVDKADHFLRVAVFNWESNYNNCGVFIVHPAAVRYKHGEMQSVL